MQKRTAALIILALGVSAAAQTPDARPAVDLQGKLYRAVFSSGTGMLAASDLAAVPEPLRGRLNTYLTRRRAFKSSYKSQPDTIQKVRSDAKRRVLERAIVSLVDTAGVEKLAADFVASAPIAYEWEGMHHGPLAEAAFAEDVLQKDPTSPLAPWCYVFIAERQRIAFETYENEKNPEGMKAAAKKYRAFVERARAAEDLIYPALIEDMERLPYLYIKGTNHPRDYEVHQAPRQNSLPSSDPITSRPDAIAGDADSGPPASNSSTLLPDAVSST